MLSKLCTLAVKKDLYQILILTLPVTVFREYPDVENMTEEEAADWHKKFNLLTLE